MKLYKPLEIPLLFDNEETKGLDNAGLDFSDDLYVVKNATFYEITSIMPRDHDKDEVTVLYSDGACYYSPMTYKELKKIVDEAMM